MGTHKFPFGFRCGYGLEWDTNDKDEREIKAHAGRIPDCPPTEGKNPERKDQEL